jgi:hypothetical protein
MSARLSRLAVHEKSPLVAPSAARRLIRSGGLCTSKRCVTSERSRCACRRSAQFDCCVCHVRQTLRSDLPFAAAVGDIHGDLQKAVTLFKLAGCVEEVDRRLVWTGGNTTVVQLGDVLDRGSQEIGAWLGRSRRIIRSSGSQGIVASALCLPDLPGAAML